MNICILGYFPPHLGGISSYTYLLSRELVKRGDNVYILTYPHENIVDVEGIPVYTAPTINIKGIRGLIFFLSSTFKLMSLVRNKKIDLVHAHYIMPPGLIAVTCKAFLGVKTAITIHGSDIFILPRNPLLKRLVKYVLNKSDYVFAVSDSIKDEVLKLDVTGIENKLKVTYNAVDVQKFTPDHESNFKEEIGIDPLKPLILFVGNLVWQKGVEYLIRAKEFINEDVEIVIVGDGPLLNEFKGIVEFENIEGIKFTCARTDIDKIMPAADIFVLPSLSEGHPIVILEAMASGKPVISTKVGGIPEIINDQVGILVNPEDSVGLAEAINKLLEDKDLRENMGKNARERSLKYSSIEIPY